MIPRAGTRGGARAYARISNFPIDPTPRLYFVAMSEDYRLRCFCRGDADVHIVTQILVNAIALIQTKGWTRRTYARNARGFYVHPLSNTATCYCLAGAIRAAGGRLEKGNGTDNDETAYALDLVRGALSRRGLEPKITVFNDAVGQTAEDVVALLQEAVAISEAVS